MKKLFTIDLGKNRLLGLDILRALAILFVVVEHGKYLLPRKWEIFHKIFVFDGVSIFFVLSGFLIGGILIKLLDNNQLTKKLIADFWIRRWFRTLPNYFLILFVLLGFSLIYDSGVSVWNAKRFFVFAQNLFYPHPDFFPEAWSLSVEEWFYLITPICIYLLIYFFKLKSNRAILIIAITVILVVLLFRFIKYTNIGVNSFDEWAKLFAKQVVTRLDSLMFGVISAYLQYYMKNKWLKYKKFLLFAGIIIFITNKILFLFDIVSYTGFYNSVISFSVISIATAFLLPYLSEVKSGTSIIHKGITMISLLSYSMYLLNLSVVQYNIIDKILWKDYFSNGYLIIFFKYSTYWILTVLGSILIYKYYELPTTRLRDNEKVKKIIDKVL